ncbi:MAG: tol-pal system protein YbgF [Gammaproteobacteria bacterium]
MARIPISCALAGLCLASGLALAQSAPVIDATSPAQGSGARPTAQGTAPVATSPIGTASPAPAVPRANPQNQALLEVLTRLQDLQEEVRQMRGEMEVQSHAIESLRQRQRDLYLDVDRRLSRLETGGQVAQPALAPASPATPQPTPTTPQPTPTAPAAGPAGQPATPAAAIDPAQEQAAYQLAFNLLKEGRYQRAIGQFQEFLKLYPNGSYADNAQYWLGEANYVTRNFRQAIEEFRKVLTNFPDSPKTPDAMLKIGYAHYELQQWNEARAVLTEIGQRFPQSTAARLAEKRLQRMAREGR